MYRSEQYNCQMNELMFQAGVKGTSERSELIPCLLYYYIGKMLWSKRRKLSSHQVESREPCNLSSPAAEKCPYIYIYYNIIYCKVVVY